MRLKYGVIGAGSMGLNHLRIASELPGIKLVGIADADPGRAEAAAQQFSIKSFSDYRQLLPEADAISLVTPTNTHFTIAKEVLAAGKHLLIEKPFTGDPDLAGELIKIADHNNLTLAVGLIESFNPAFQKLLSLIKGEKLHGIDIKRFSPFPERISDTDVIFDMMLHDIHLLRLITQNEIDSIKASGKKIQSKLLDHVTAVITYKNGLICRLEANRVFAIKTRNISVTTEKNMLDADLLNKRIYIRDFTSPTPSTVPVKPFDQLTAEITNFILAVKGKKSLLFKASEALASLRLAKEVKSAC